ncbi:MAG: N-acetylmuramoyl-L-alanine amidase, partial [bacterium]|nr:N-acetylmuramoyl-L-alanine amidase [bacterium]
LNDRIADRVEELLAAYDCTVLRVDDTTGAKDISLSTRVKSANNAGADFYLSMHHNAGLGGRAGGGTVVFYCSGKAERQGQAQRLYDAVVARTGLRGNRSQKVVNKGFYVIKNTKMPSLLVENGFMDSPTDVPVILTEQHAEKTAQGVLSFLISELALKKKAETAVEEKPQTVPEEKPQECITSPCITVAKEDTLSGLGKKYGIAWKEIADANGLKSPYTLKIGQKLYLPAGTSNTNSSYYPAYTGKKTTLAAAMTSLGINSSYANRKQIATANGISGYAGTASQNTEMYNLLVAGLLKRE